VERIFKIAHDDYAWDCFSDFVIVANNKEEVREMAISKAADEGREVWKTAEIEELCTYTGEKKEPYFVLASYR